MWQVERVEAVKLTQFVTRGTPLGPEVPSFALSVAMVVGEQRKLLPPSPELLLGGDSRTELGEALKVILFNSLRLRRGTLRPKQVKEDTQAVQ